MTRGHDTDPMRMSESDRVAVENRVDKLQATLLQYRDDRKEEIDRFQRHQMEPLKDLAVGARSTSFIAMGIGIAALVFVTAMLVLLVLVLCHVIV